MSLFWCWERCSWAKMTMPVGLCTRRTAEFGAVDVLAAGAARAREGDVDVGGIDLDVDRVVDHRIDGDGGEARVAARVRVVGRDAHETVHAGFRLEPAVGVLALDLEGGGLDARLLAGALVDKLHLEAAPLRPTHVHARQHRGPVLALGAAGAGVDLDVGVHAVGLARQQRLDALSLHLLVEARERCLGLGALRPRRPRLRRARSASRCRRARARGGGSRSARARAAGAGASPSERLPDCSRGSDPRRACSSPLGGPMRCPGQRYLLKRRRAS